MSANVTTVVVPTDRLPECPQERRACLDAYFDDLLASVRAVPEGWEIDLNWPTEADYYVDPCICQGLSWWQADTNVADVHRQVSYTASGQISLNDAWTLYSWSNWLLTRRLNKKVTNEVVILHVDDHTDLMTPRLNLDRDSWRDGISGEGFDLQDPNSVSSAILNGAIGVGSFMSPLIYAIPCVNIRHLSQTAPNEGAQEFSLIPTSMADTILNVGQSRPGLRFSPKTISKPNDTQRVDAKQYRITRRLDLWLDEIPDAPVLLHVDMDYFNNRYNGDSDWATREPRHDPALPDIIRAIDALFNAICKSDVVSRIEDVTVALSPGFFPSELWAASITRMQDRMKPLGWKFGMPRSPAKHG